MVLHRDEERQAEAVAGAATPVWPSPGAGGDTLGLALSIPAFRRLSGAMAGVGRLSPWTLVVVPVALIAVTRAARYLPARRASRIDPTLALRYE